MRRTVNDEQALSRTTTFLSVVTSLILLSKSCSVLMKTSDDCGIIYSIQKEHAIISTTNGEYIIQPASHGAKIKINGCTITGPTVLTHKDRILLGSTTHIMFQFLFVSSLRSFCSVSAMSELFHRRLSASPCRFMPQPHMLHIEMSQQVPEYSVEESKRVLSVKLCFHTNTAAHQH